MDCTRFIIKSKAPPKRTLKNTLSGSMNNPYQTPKSNLTTPRNQENISKNILIKAALLTPLVLTLLVTLLLILLGVIENHSFVDLVSLLFDTLDVIGLFLLHACITMYIFALPTLLWLRHKNKLSKISIALTALAAAQLTTLIFTAFEGLFGFSWLTLKDLLALGLSTAIISGIAYACFLFILFVLQKRAAT